MQVATVAWRLSCAGGWAAEGAECAPLAADKLAQLDDVRGIGRLRLVVQEYSSSEEAQARRTAVLAAAQRVGMRHRSGAIVRAGQHARAAAHVGA
jgi:hypothetical protein